MYKIWKMRKLVIIVLTLVTVIVAFVCWSLFTVIYFKPYHTFHKPNITENSRKMVDHFNIIVDLKRQEKDIYIVDDILVAVTTDSQMMEYIRQEENNKIKEHGKLENYMKSEYAGWKNIRIKEEYYDSHVQRVARKWIIQKLFIQYIATSTWKQKANEIDKYIIYGSSYSKLNEGTFFYLDESYTKQGNVRGGTSVLDAFVHFTSQDQVMDLLYNKDIQGKEIERNQETRKFTKKCTFTLVSLVEEDNRQKVSLSYNINQWTEKGEETC